MSCRTDRLEDGGLERRLIEHILGCEALLSVLSAAEEMAFPDWYLSWEAGIGGQPGAFRRRVSSP